MSTAPPETPSPATESTPETPEPAAAAPTWEELFKDEDPAKVKEALENSRKWETRAKENKKALDAAAPKLKQYESLEQASKTDQQRLEEAASQAKTDLESARTEAARLRVAIKHGLDDNDLRLLNGTEEEMAETATYLAGLKAAAQPGKRTPAPNPAQGTGASGAPDQAAQIEAARKAGDWRTAMHLENQKLTPTQG